MNCPECKRDAGRFKGTCKTCRQKFDYGEVKTEWNILEYLDEKKS